MTRKTLKHTAVVGGTNRVRISLTCNLQLVTKIWRTRQDSHLQTLRSKRSMIVISSRMHFEIGACEPRATSPRMVQERKIESKKRGGHSNRRGRNNFLFHLHRQTNQTPEHAIVKRQQAFRIAAAKIQQRVDSIDRRNLRTQQFYQRCVTLAFKGLGH